MWRVTARSNTWSRLARRRRARTVDDEGPEGTTGSAVFLRLNVTLLMDATEVGDEGGDPGTERMQVLVQVDWTEGKSSEAFNSLFAHLTRKLAVATRDGLDKAQSVALEGEVRDVNKIN